VLAEVERLLDEYLDARNEFERDLQLALEGNQPSEAVNTLKALTDKFHARKVAFDQYVAAAANAVAEE
jgi:hypothetical protein